MTSTPEHTKGAWTSFKFTDARSPTDDALSSSEAGSPIQDNAYAIPEEVVQDQLNASFTSHHGQDRSAQGMQHQETNTNTPVTSFRNGQATQENLSVNDSASFAYGYLDEDERSGAMLKVKDRKRRNTKMRFSFLMNEDGNSAMGTKRAKSRPSLLDLEVPTDVEDDEYQGSQSTVRTSFYVDAVENLEPGASSQLSTITEDGHLSTVDIRTIPSTTTSKARATEEHPHQPEAQQPSITSTSASFVSDHEDAFDDMIVLTNVPYPTHTLPCTRATATTTTRLKASAFSLMRYSESEAIFSGLMIRLERMLDTEIDIVAQDKRLPKPSLSRLVRRLRDFLRKIKEGRVATGEESRIVEHELRMCEWMYDAAREGVMHVRTRRCRCRPDWSGP
jgi:hypothetical protein